MKKALTLVLCALFFIQLQAQQRSCDMEAHMEMLLQDPAYQQLHQEKIQRFAQFEESLPGGRVPCENPVLLPIAIHFQEISNPDPECLRALAQNQIDILNNDIQGINADISLWTNEASGFFPGVNNAESCIEFCIATQNHPPGFGLQDGDLAVTINQTSGDFSSAWSGYVNVFVRNISALGYSPLGGNGNGDGVTIDIQAFGSGPGCGQVSPSPPFHLGRTLTHEIGHYLWLHHIWRNAGCGLDDLVEDTPLQDVQYFGCPANGASSCGSTDMHMNYMDYTNDPCMYMFSAGQATRMENYMNSNLINVINNAAAVCLPPPPPTCDDGIQNGNETGVDCGGPDCPPCQEPSTCSDGIQNGNETGVDCGGPDCPPCQAPPTCSDGIQNGNETGVDCGGPDCPPCSSGCEGHSLTLTIVLDNLGNQVTWDVVSSGGIVWASGGPYPGGQNGMEITESICVPDGCYTFTIYDSGGNGLCCRSGSGSYTLTDDADGSVIASGASFAFSSATPFCLEGAEGPTCIDGIQNGNETGIDCGGPDCLPCQGATCSDGIQNGNETGVDCGGPDCPPCPSCDDGVQNGSETGVDCGGPDCPPCQGEECGPPSGSWVEFTGNPQNVTIHWNAVPQATMYEVRYRLAGADFWATISTSNTFIFLSRLQTGAQYEYQIRALCPSGWTAWTASSFFTTNTLREAYSRLRTKELYTRIPAGDRLYLDVLFTGSRCS
jgi:hypothetical protein